MAENHPETPQNLTTGAPAWERQIPPVFWWRVILAGAAIIFLGIGSLDLFRLLVRPLALLILGVSIATTLAPFVNWLSGRLPRVAAIGLVYLMLVLMAVGIGVLVVPTLFAQAQEAGKHIPDLAKQGQDWLNRWQGPGGFSITDSLTGQVGSLAGLLISLPLTLGSSLVDLVLVLFISIYWLVSAPGMNRFYLSLFPKDRQARVSKVMEGIGGALGGYVRGTVINGLIVGVLSFLGLSVIGAQYPVVLGLISGVFELIPVLGPILAGAIIVLIVLLQSSSKALIALLYFFLLQQFENHILVPNIMRSQTNLSSLVAAFALFAGASIGGLLGALVAIPVVSALEVLLRYVIAPEIRRQSGAEPVEEDYS